MMRLILVDRAGAATDGLGDDWNRASMTRADDLSLPSNTLLAELDDAARWSIPTG